MPLAAMRAILQAILSTNEATSELAYHNARSHRITSGYARDDRGIGNSKPSNAVYFQMTIYNGHLVQTHLRSATLVIESSGSIAHEVLELSTLQRPRRHLPAGEPC